MSTTAERELVLIPTTQVVEQEGHNPRGPIDRADPAFLELKSSVEQLGVLQPILVGPAEQNGKGPIYPLIAGHRRHAAASELKLPEIPALVADLEGGEFTAAVVENLVRVDLSPLQEARAIQRMRDGGMKQADAAKAFGKSERWARERGRLLNLPEFTAKAIDEGEIPTEATVHLERIAKASAAACDAIAEAALGEGGVQTSYAATDLVDMEAVADLLGKVAKEHGLQSANHAWNGVAPAGLAVSKEARKQLAAAFKEIPVTGAYSSERKGFEFDDGDLKIAKAKGALLELNYRRWGAPYTVAYITDPELTAEICERKLPMMLEEAEKRVAQHEARRQGTIDNGASAAEAEKERVRRERDQAKRQEADRELGERLGAMKAPKATDVDAVRMVCAMALGWDEYNIGECVAESLGGIGIERYMPAEGAEGEEEQSSPGETFLEDLAAATTAQQCLRLTLQFILAERHRISRSNVPGLWGPGDIGRIDTDELADELAVKFDVLPAAQLKAAKERRAERERIRKEAAKRSGAEAG